MLGRVFSSSTLSISFYSLLDCKVSTEKFASSCMGFHYNLQVFSLSSFKCLSLPLIVDSLSECVLEEDIFMFTLFGDL